MRSLNYKEAFVAGYELAERLGNDIDWDGLLNAFHLVSDPAVRGVEESISDVGIAVTGNAMNHINVLYAKMSRSRHPSVDVVLRAWAEDLSGNKIKTLDEVEDLYKELKAAS